MQHGAILNIAAFADMDQVTISSNDDIEPDAYLVFQDYIANNIGTGSNKMVLSAQFGATDSEFVVHSSSCPFSLSIFD
jgi:hypothetical protein